MENVNKNLIAPCGMNCALCSAYLREKNKCPGCNNGPTIPHCQKCRLKHCEERSGFYCYECDKFPCPRLKQLDKRYREKYGMSEIKNLEFIRDRGIDEFVKKENTKWRCPKCGQLRCCHDGLCHKCDRKK